MKVRVTRDLDWATPIPPVGIHDGLMYVPPAPPLPPVPASNVPHIEPPTPMNWFGGSSTHKFTSSVNACGTSFALDGHDIGAFIPHLNLPPVPVNLLLTLIVPFSSRPMKFSASTVHADKAAVGTSDLTSTIPLPMMVCMDPISPPLVYPINVMNTVNVGMTAGDILAGVFACAASMAVDQLLSGGPPKGALGTFTSVLLNKVGLNPKDFLLKNVLAIATGLVKIGLTGEGTIDLTVGSPFLNAKRSFARTRDGQWTDQSSYTTPRQNDVVVTTKEIASGKPSSGRVPAETWGDVAQSALPWAPFGGETPL